MQKHTDDTGIECSVLLSDIFSALESVQLPMDLDQMRVEIDWNTDFDEVAMVAVDKGDTITSADIKKELFEGDDIVTSSMKNAPKLKSALKDDNDDEA